MNGHSASTDIVEEGPAAAPSGRSEGGAVRRALTAIVLVGATLRLLGLGAEPLWLDEAFSWRWAHLPLEELWGAAARTETNPPLWFTLERWVMLALGDDEAALRLPAAILGVAAVSLAFLVGRALAGHGAGLAAASMIATDPLLVAYSREARGYTLLVCGALLALWGAQELLADPDRSERREMRARRSLVAGTAYAAGTTLAVYAHNTGSLVPVLTVLGGFVRWLLYRRGERPSLRPFLFANGPPLLLGLVWLPVLVEQAAAASNVGWITQPGPRWALVSWAGGFGPHFLGLPPVVAALFGLPVLLLAGLGLRRAGTASAVLLTFAVGGPLLVLGLGLLVRPLWLERVLLPYLAATLVLAAAGLAGRQWWPRAVPVLLALVLLPRAADTVALHARSQKLAWPEVVRTVARAFRPGDEILIAPHVYHWPWAYYAARLGFDGAAVGLLVGGPPPPQAPRIEPVDRGLRLARPDELGSLLEFRARAWLLVYKRRGGDPGEILSRLARSGRLEPLARFEGAWDRGELELFLWLRTEPGPA